MRNLLTRFESSKDIRFSMTIRLFRDLELFQPLATVYNSTVFSLIFSLSNLPINVLPCLFVDVFAEVPVP
jgi:hypothetical protein